MRDLCFDELWVKRADGIHKLPERKSGNSTIAA